MWRVGWWETEFLESRDCQMLLPLLEVYWMLTEYFGGKYQLNFLIEDIGRVLELLKPHIPGRQMSYGSRTNVSQVPHFVPMMHRWDGTWYGRRGGPGALSPALVIYVCLSVTCLNMCLSLTVCCVGCINIYSCGCGWVQNVHLVWAHWLSNCSYMSRYMWVCTPGRDRLSQQHSEGELSVDVRCCSLL